MESWVLDIEKVNEFNFLNEEVKELTSRWSQNLVNARTLVTSCKKSSNAVYEA